MKQYKDTVGLSIITMDTKPMSCSDFELLKPLELVSVNKFLLINQWQSKINAQESLVKSQIN